MNSPLRASRFTISELSRKLILTPATLVPAVDALERHGLVVRGQDPLDRRRTPLLLTEQGHDILVRLPPVDDQDILVKALDTLGPERTQDLLALMHTLVREMVDRDVVDELAAIIRATKNQEPRTENRG